MTTPPPLDIGSMNFAELRRSGCYYADKTAHLSELIVPAQDPLLLTRPRRFGKTLTQYTLKSFLELNYEHPGTPNADAEVFEGLAVSEDRQLCAQYQSQFPVIFITFKDVQQNTLADARGELCGLIADLYDGFGFLARSPQLDPGQREDFAALRRMGTVDDRDGRRRQLLSSSLLLLAQCLHTVYKRPAYILIDEYDVPLLWAAHYSTEQDRSYYDTMRVLLFTLLGKVLKTGDPAVRRCLMTGCLRLTPPGSISGLNNLLELGMDSWHCAQLMGFTQEEVDTLLSVYGLSDHRDAVRNWYDGYVCGGTRLYNPWSLLHFCYEAQAHPQVRPKNYWVRTSSNDFRRYFISELSADSMTLMQALLDGQAVSLRLRGQLSHPDLDVREYDDRAFFTLLYQTGYLTRAQPDPDADADDERYVIPNCEVLDCFCDKIYDYFRQNAVRINPRFTALIASFLDGNPAGVQQGLTWLYTHYLDMQAAVGRLRQGRGTAEAEERERETMLQQVEERRGRERELGYQVLTQGVLTLFDGAAIAGLTMEHKLGTGRVDISFTGREAGTCTACLLEFRVARGSSDRALDAAAERGLKQTRDHGCAAALLDDNPQLQVIYSYGIGCRARSCRVRVEMIRRSPS